MTYQENLIESFVTLDRHIAFGTLDDIRAISDWTTLTCFASTKNWGGEIVKQILTDKAFEFLSNYLSNTSDVFVVLEARVHVLDLCLNIDDQFNLRTLCDTRLEGVLPEAFLNKPGCCFPSPI